jgi:tripartite-type tricarboxylate transporter receptor subunit TctC
MNQHPCARPGARRPLLALLALTGAGALLPWASAQAQTPGYPARPVTFVVPFAASSATDLLARALGQSITEQTKQAVVVDNKAGAGGMLAAQAVARAAADGLTVLIATNTTQAANPHLFKKMPYDPVKDFAPVSGLGKGGQVLVVRADAAYKTVADLLVAARRQPGKLSFGSGSSSSRVAGELFQQMSGTDILHVPYKSNPLAITDLVGGQITMMFTDTATGMPQIKGGKLRALGVTASKRVAVLPEVPTIDEAGVKGYDMGYWFAAYVPAGTPAPVVARLNDLLHVALKSPAVKAFFEASGGEPFPTSPEVLARFQQDETAKWGKVIKAAGIEAE